jgi:hypothetical protein
MKLLLTCALLFSIQAAKLPPRKLMPQQKAHKLVWYLTDEGAGSAMLWETASGIVEEREYCEGCRRL